MKNWSVKLGGSADSRYWPLAVFLLIYPIATVIVRGGASALLIAASIVSLGACLVAGRHPTSAIALRRSDRWVSVMCVAMASPLVAVALSEAWHGQLHPNAFDTPARFLAAVPLFLLLRRVPVRWLRWGDLSFAIGAIAAMGVCLWSPHDWGEGRLGSVFLNPIHFGDIAMILGVLSALSIHWWQKDSGAVCVLKIAGLLAGLSASLLTGSRGGWLALPLILALVVIVVGGEKSRRWRLLVLVAAVLGLVGVYLASGMIHDRIQLVWADLAQYAQGQKDTSIGIRLQIYEAALTLIPRHWVFGLGAGGFGASLQALVDAGQMTPMAADLGRGEVHNEMLAYLANYGLVGGLAIVAIHLAPGVLCWRYLKVPATPQRRAALMGLVFALAFFVFGLTVEIYTLKMTASFYAAVIACLAAIASHTPRPAGVEAPSSNAL